MGTDKALRATLGRIRRVRRLWARADRSFRRGKIDRAEWLRRRSRSYLIPGRGLWDHEP
jgi:hypothetical protein